MTGTEAQFVALFLTLGVAMFAFGLMTGWYLRGDK